MSDSDPKFSEHRLAAGQGRVYARDYAGDGPALVLMHGFPDNLHIYDRLIPHLVAAGRRVVAFDFLGFGRSDRIDPIWYGFPQQLADLEAVVAGLDLGAVVPVGHDASGPAAINFALAHPERTASVCLLNTFYAADPNIRLPELIQLFATGSLDALSAAVLASPEQFAWLLRFQQRMFMEPLGPEQREVYASALAPVINGNFQDEGGSGPAFARLTSQLLSEVGRNTARVSALKAMETPVRVVWGERDPYLTPGVAAQFETQLGNATSLLLPAGHWPQVDMPERVAQAMLS